MTPRSSYVLVGVFVLILGAALIAGLLYLTTGGPPRDYDGYLLYMTESVSGLNVDAEVRYKGVSVGRVSEIRLDKDNPEVVRITLLVLEDTPVKQDTVATLEMQGITGIANINLTGGSKMSAPLEAQSEEEYPVIQSRASLLVRLDDTVSELLESLIDTSNRVGMLLNEENQNQISATLANTQILTDRLNSRADELSGVLRSADELIGRVNQATDNLPKLFDQINQTASSLEQMANSLAAAGASMETTTLELQKTVRESGQDIRHFTAGALPEANGLISELKVTASNLRQISESLQDDPSQVLFGGPEPQLGPGE